MKRVLLVRHAEAEPKQIGRGDLERHLTEQGRDDAESVGRGIAALYRRFDAVISSEAVRAIETADAVCKAVVAKQRIATENLNPGCGAEGWKRTLSEIPEDAETAIMVGHEPDFSAMLGAAIGAPVARFRFKKSGCAEIGWDDDGRAELVAFLPPDILKKIGQAGV
jgi:phosphohistidine phosphatase